jgi:hypothetical protein
MGRRMKNEDVGVFSKLLEEIRKNKEVLEGLK